MSKIVLIDYGMGNLNSVKKKLDRLKTDSLITRDEKEILEADAVILPGAGAFGDAMEAIRTQDLISPLKKLLHRKHR